MQLNSWKKIKQLKSNSILIREYFHNITFTQPLYFWLFILLPILAGWYVMKNNNSKSSISVSWVAGKELESWKAGFRHLPFILRMLCISAIIFALAKPQTQNQDQ